MGCDGSMRVFSGDSISPFSDFPFFACLAVETVYDFVLEKQTMFLMKIALDRISLSVQKLLESSCRQFSEYVLMPVTYELKKGKFGYHSITGIIESYETRRF